MSNTNDQTVSIVTGAGSGIGRAIAKRLARHGPVVLVGRRHAPLEQTGMMIDRSGSGWLSIQADINIADDRDRVIERTVDHFGRLDWLINNAAIGTCRPLLELQESEIEDLVAINLTAPLLLTRLALPHIAKSLGCVVSIGSIAAIDPFPGLGAYGCTKAGLEALARAIRTEYPDIRGYTVHPGAVETDMLRSIVSKNDLPSDHVLSPDDIAGAVEGLITGTRAESNGASVVVSKTG